MKYLIVNADDFGYSLSINKGIIKAHVDGIVTATSVMVDSVGAEEAMKLSSYPDLAVGLHFVPNAATEAKTELERQFQKFVSIVGTRPSHIDIHKVRSDDMDLKRDVIEFANSYDIPARYSGKAKFIDSFFGPHANNNVSIDQLKDAISQATEAYNELMCHVGYSDDYLRAHSSYSDMREKELDSICSAEIKHYIEQQGITLTNWSQINII